MGGIEEQVIDELLEDLFKNDKDKWLSVKKRYSYYPIGDAWGVIKELYLISVGEKSTDEYYRNYARMLKLNPVNLDIVRKFAENVRSIKNDLLYAEYISICVLIKASLIHNSSAEVNGKKSSFITKYNFEEVLTKDPISVVKEFYGLLEANVSPRNQRHCRELEKRKEELFNNATFQFRINPASKIHNLLRIIHP